MKKKRWSEAETQILLDAFEDGGLHGAIAALESAGYECAVSQVSSKACAMGISKRNVWTDKEDRILIDNYRELGLKATAAIMLNAGFVRTNEAVKQRARVLNLHRPLKRTIQLVKAEETNEPPNDFVERAKASRFCKWGIVEEVIADNGGTVGQYICQNAPDV